MRVAVASGKGGTGKTTVATSLALALVHRDDPPGAEGPGDVSGSLEVQAGPVLVLDCDVEAPNAHLYLKPVFEKQREVGLLLPVVDDIRCTRCGLCAEVCQFNALAVIGDEVLLFPELCHGCGSCALMCPDEAISEEIRVLGLLQSGPTATGPYLMQGTMNVGDLLAVPVIRQLQCWAAETRVPPWQTVILDAPPGTSCPVVQTLRGADFALLVTEPTPFGLHDLRLMAEVVWELDLPAGVIINRDGASGAREQGQEADKDIPCPGSDDHMQLTVDQFCAEAGLPVLMRIPHERAIAEGIARGEPLIAARPPYRKHFQDLYARIQSLVAGEAA